MNQPFATPVVRQTFFRCFIILIISLLAQNYLFAQTNPRVFINEVLSSNLSTNPDMVDFASFSDWIELYNDENVAVNVGGYYLSDDVTLPMKWQIPSNIVIPAKGFYLIWADEFNNVPGNTLTRNWWPNNIRFTTKWCHTNFKLNKDGETIGLYGTGGTLIDSVSLLGQITDVSFGRQPDGSSNWKYFGEPSPLNSNTSIGLNSVNVSGHVNFSIEGGFYQGSVQIELTSNSGNGTIRYTTDGSKPLSSSQQYTAPISLDKNTVLRARVYEDSKLPGKVLTNSYFINETRTLPVVSLVTDPTFLWDKQLGIYLNSYKEREIPVSLEYFPLNSSRAFFMDAGARIGGENIFRFAQKPFNIYAHSDYGYAHIPYKIFDDLPFEKYKQLYIRNSGSDWTSTIFRDGMLVTVLKNRILNAMQDYRPSVMYLNGNYWGINDLREKIIDDYFLQHYNVDPSDLDHLEDTNVIISGDSTDFVNLTAFANGNDLSDSTNYAYVSSKIDIYDLMDFVIVQDYIGNSSWGHNRETWRDKRVQKLWRWVLVDMDRGFDAGRISTNQLTDIYNNFTIFRKLCANTNFKNEFVQRYAQHMNKTFANDRVVAIIDSIKSLLQDEMPRHIQKWGTLIDSLSIDGGFGKQHSVSSMTNWNSEVDKFKNFSAQRPPYAVQYLNGQFGLTGRANLKISSNIQNEGKITVNNFSENFGESNLYFKNIPLHIQASPPPGYSFKQWKEVVLSTNLNLIAPGSEWKYSDGNATPANWNTTNLNDASWKTGLAQFGYGEGDEVTVISYGPDAQNKYITSYYRRSFQITNLADVKELKLKLLRDDGAVVYLNGTEIVRSNMPTGLVSFGALAPVAVGGVEETTFFEFTIDKLNLVAGTNVLAVEIHQSGGTSSDVSFDLALDAVLNQQSSNANIIGTTPSITYTMTDNTELIAEFEKTSSSEIAQVINEPLTLAKVNSPYFVTNNVTIESNGIVTVEPGTVIYFSAGKGITVKGKILMNGSAAEPITLTSYYPEEKWGAVCFDYSTGTSELNYVNISLATNGSDTVNFFASLSSFHSTVKLNRVHFNDVKLPISSQWSDMTIDSCTFQNVMEVGDYINCNGGNIRVLNSVFKGNSIVDEDAMDLGFNTGVTEIINNTIMDFTGSNSDGIDLGDGCLNVVIEGNVISNCFDKGVSIGQGSQAILTRNSISGCDMGVGIKDELSHADIINGTFYNNNAGVACFEKVDNRGGGTADILNSIFANSKKSSYTVDNVASITINYSLSNTDTLPGQGNIFGEPLLVNPDGANFHIQVKSPCIDKGDPQTANDLDGTRADIGAFMNAGQSKSDIIINEINYNSSATFDSGDWIELYNTTAGAIDLSGWVFMDENLTPSFVLPLGTVLQPGSFVVLYGDITLFSAKYPDVKNILGNMNSGLSGGGEALFLYNSSGQLVDSLTYDDKTPWPVDADGNGSSLELRNPTLENALGTSWNASIGHGTPGAINSTYVVGIESNKNNSLPVEFALDQNYPNPFNPGTMIRYQLAANSFVTLKIYDVLGHELSTLVNEDQSAGFYQKMFTITNADGLWKQLASGIYFYQLKAVSIDGKHLVSFIKKMVLLK